MKKKSMFCMLVLIYMCLLPIISLSTVGEPTCGSGEPYEVKGIVDTVYSSGDKVFVFFRNNDVCYEFNDTCMEHFKILEDSEEEYNKLTVYYNNHNNIKEIVVIHVAPYEDMFVLQIWLFIIGVVIGLVGGAFLFSDW